jgi:hypothetical protein
MNCPSWVISGSMYRHHELRKMLRFGEGGGLAHGFYEVTKTMLASQARPAGLSYGVATVDYYHHFECCYQCRKFPSKRRQAILSRCTVQAEDLWQRVRST